MAIYISIKKTDGDEKTWYYLFTNAEEKPYGLMAIDVESGDIELIETYNESRIHFAYPRARRALKRAFEEGTLGNEHCYAA